MDEINLIDDPDQRQSLRSMFMVIERYLKKHPQEQITFKAVNLPADPPTREYTFVGIEILIVILGAFILGRILFRTTERFKILEDLRQRVSGAEYSCQRSFEIYEQSKEVVTKLQGTLNQNSKIINGHPEQLYSRVKALEPTPPEVNPNIVVVESTAEGKST